MSDWEYKLKSKYFNLCHSAKRLINNIIECLKSNLNLSVELVSRDFITIDYATDSEYCPD